MNEQIENLSKDMETMQKCKIQSGKLQNLRRMDLAANWRQKKQVDELEGSSREIVQWKKRGEQKDSENQSQGGGESSEKRRRQGRRKEEKSQKDRRRRENEWDIKELI